MQAHDPVDIPATAPGLRVIVTAPPHCGQPWLTEALAAAYRLERLAGADRPVGRRRGACRRRADAAFAPGSIYATRSAYSPRLVDRWRSQPVHIVTVVRDPYDLYAELDREQGARALAGVAAGFADGDGVFRATPLPGDAGVSDHLLRRYEKLLRRSVRWSRDERVIAVRYEDLRDDPVRALAGIAARIHPLDPPAIEAALRTAAAARIRSVTPPGAPAPGASLRPGQLDDIRWRCADDISLLGYAIR
ncbi:MAG: hypothetical protein ACKOWF_01050 [Chloroflexota bacterium]